MVLRRRASRARAPLLVCEATYANVEKTWPEIPDNAMAHARDYLAIWPPNTQRKCMTEIKQNKIERKYWLIQNKCRDAVEFLKVSSRILKSCFSSTNFTGPAFHRCLFSKLGSYNALYYRGLKSKFASQTDFDPP